MAKILGISKSKKNIMLKYKDYINSMTLEEKVSLLSGANFWNTKPLKRLGIPSIMLTDGPHGLRKQVGKADHLGLGKSVPATCFPTAAALASSWDEALIFDIGKAIGTEAVANGVNVLLAPGLNIVRDPLAGRAFEYFSEDPYVSGKLAAAMVRGIQSNGIAATPKHFAVNSQEHMRMSINEVVDERTLHEIYLEGFRRVIKESQPKMLMTSYNKVNGVYSNENKYLLKDNLIDLWGYSGALVTDWGGNNDSVAGVNIGGALEMPSSQGLMEKELIKAVRSGDLKETLLDKRVNTFLKLVFETTSDKKASSKVDYEMHDKLAAEASARSIVLLKNDDSILPLANGARVALIGDFAKVPRYQGSGSSLVNPTRVTSALEAFSISKTVEIIGYEPGFKRMGGKSKQYKMRAISLAKKADIALVFVGLDESKEAEGIDRSTMKLPLNQTELIQALCKIHKKIIVVLVAGGPVELPFADDVAAIIHGSLGGQASGKGIADIVIGKRNPSGKLAVTYPYKYADTPTARYFPGKERTAEHREGLYVGYRYYETANVPARYPFGYGLSYTKFVYGNLKVTETGTTFSITNKGSVAGEEIAQLYIQPPKSDTFRPIRELKGFVKVFLQPHETKSVEIKFDDHTFAHYNIDNKSWAIAGGEYTVEISASVKDIRLRQLLVKSYDSVRTKSNQTELKPYYTGKVQNVSDEEFEALLGSPLPTALWDHKIPLTYDDTISQLQYGRFLGRMLYIVLRAIRRLFFVFNKPYLANNMAFIMDLPFSKIPNFTGGKISKKAIKRFLRIR